MQSVVNEVEEQKESPLRTQSNFGPSPDAVVEDVPDIRKDDICAASEKLSVNSDDKKQCRICFEEENEKDNPLLSPCKCSGSMEFVHYKCLQHWRSRNENKKQVPHVTTYTWKAFHCELCKFKLQDSYKVGNQSFQIFEIAKPPCSNIVIETS